MAKRKSAKEPASRGAAGRRKPKSGDTASTAIDTIIHVGDKRPNIPTRELAGFADDGTPKKVLYPRDPSLDPQLVWRGKDEQDAKPLEVPAVPIYVQEKIHPRVIVEDIRARAEAGRPKAVDLFSDFNGLDDFAKKLEFYQHDQHWTNRLILGDSLLVMTSLAEKERLKCKIQCVFIDPPYGIKFQSNWQVSTRSRDVKDAKAKSLTRQPEQIKAFRDTWEDGIHSYLATWRDRLTVARDLLAESGSAFIQIGDQNVHLLRSLLDEVFGGSNFLSLITFKKTAGATGDYLPGIVDYLLWYGKSIEHTKYRPLFLDKVVGGQGGGQYTWLEEPTGVRRRASADELEQPPPGSRIFRLDNLTSQSAGREKGEGAASWFPVKIGRREYRPTMQTRWKTNETGMANLVAAGRVHPIGNTLTYVRYLQDFPVFPINNLWDDTVTSGFSDPKTYVVQTNPKVVERCILMTTDPGDLVLDPTCGSGTTAYVAEQWGRRWITIDTSRVAVALARTRLIAARFPYFLLSDSPEGRKKQIELTSQSLPAEAPRAQRDVRKGFVYETVPHVTLKSIATNPDIREGMRPEEIDRAIQRHADTEILFDQPYEDKAVVRLTGPFTVESLSPHRNLPEPETEGPPPAPAAEAISSGPNYVQLILDNLRKAGVKGLDKRDRIEFDRLDPFPGAYVQAEGATITGAAVRVSVGPEFGTVGDQWIKAAALQAIKGSRCDLLLVCAFAFEASVLEQTAELKKEIQFGKLRILPVRMNPDLAMGDVLKKTGAGHLFTVFGEPDIDIKKAKGGQVTVTIRGLDVFDPTTGEVRSGGTDDIACWFVDTAYDGQSFFVRQAYFCGADDPYEKLKRALKAEIDEAEWAKLYSTTSVPFDPPTSGKIAVKVINHFGDEVLQVYDVG